MSSPKISTKVEGEILYENETGVGKKLMDLVNKCTVGIIAGSLGHRVVNKVSNMIEMLPRPC